MKIKQTLRTLVAGIVLAVGFMGVLLPATTTFAATEPGNNGCGTNTTIIKCNNVDVTQAGVQNSAIWSILLTAINILTAGIGLAAVGGVIYGAILYTSAGGSQEQVKKAMGIITNVVIGVVAYALMFAFLNFLIPGGIFN